MYGLEDLQKVDLRNSISPAPKEEINFIKLNKERPSVANKLMTQLNNGVPPPNYRKGVVPKYDITTSSIFSDFKLIISIFPIFRLILYYNTIF